MDSPGYRIEFLGNSCGQHGPYTFYRGIQYWNDNKCHSLSLGEFFHARMSSNDQVIPMIGELQLLWEERHHEGLKLSSVRLYILPENCPEGKQPHHGQDEILAEDDKIVFQVEDLMKLVVLEPVQWTRGLTAVQKFCPRVFLSRSNGTKADGFMLCQPGCKDVVNNMINNVTGTRVIILSYPRYCRYRAALKRFEGCTNRWLADFLISAVGGFSTCGMETRVMFCRNTVEHPVLEKHESRMNHLAPSLKGRRRKKRPTSKTNESEDSNESETSSEKNSLRFPSATEETLEKRRQTEKSPVLVKTKPNCKKKSLIKEKGFLKRLHKYMNDKGTPIVRIPTLGFKAVNLYQFYQCTQQLGGYDEVTEKRQWKQVYDQLGGSPGNTSAATGTRKNYEKLLLAYEKHVCSRDKLASSDEDQKTIRSAKDTSKCSSDSRPDPETNNTSNCSSLYMKELEVTNDRKTDSLNSKVATDVSDLKKKTSQSEFQPRDAQKSDTEKKSLRKRPVLNCRSQVQKEQHSHQSPVAALTDKRRPNSATCFVAMNEKVVDTCKKTTPQPEESLQETTGKSNEALSAEESITQHDDHTKMNLPQTCSEKPDIATDNVSVTACKIQSRKISTDCVKGGNISHTVLPSDVLAPQPETLPKEFNEIIESKEESSNTSPVQHCLPSLAAKKAEDKKLTASFGAYLTPHPARTSAELDANQSSAASNNIRSSSISRKLMSGGHAVVESCIVEDQSKKILGNAKEYTNSKEFSISALPTQQAVEELLAPKSLAIHHALSGTLDPSRCLNRDSVLKTSSLMPHIAYNSLKQEPVAISQSSKLEALFSMKTNAVSPSILLQSDTTSVPIKEGVLKHTSDRSCSITTLSTQSLLSDMCPVQNKASGSPLKRWLTSGSPSESLLIKKPRIEADKPASMLPVTQTPVSHQTTVISSPIKRFIDRTKCWMAAPDSGPIATLNPVWSADDQPTDLSMKTLKSQQQANEATSSHACISLGSDFPQNEPLDLSKSSTTYPSSKNQADVHTASVSCYEVANSGQTMSKNGHLLPTSTANKVAFVTPSLRSSSSFLPTPSYPLLNLQTAACTSPLPQIMRPEQIASLVAYAPSLNFHPAFQIFSTIAAPGSLLCSTPVPSTSPRLAVPLFPVIPITQNANVSSSDRMPPSVPETVNPSASTILRRAVKKF